MRCWKWCFTGIKVSYRQHNSHLAYIQLVPCFMSWNKRSQNLSIGTKKTSTFVHNFVYIPVSEHFSFVKIIHPSDSCGISRSWLSSTLCWGQEKATLKCAVSSHNTMPQMSQVLRECTIGMLTAGMSTRHFCSEWNVSFLYHIGAHVQCLQEVFIPCDFFFLSPIYTQ